MLKSSASRCSAEGSTCGDGAFVRASSLGAFTDSGEPIEITPAGTGQSGGSSIEFPAGSYITCDFYYSLAGSETPTPAPTVKPAATATAPATTTVTKLPSTGTGSAPVQNSRLPLAEVVAGLMVVVFASSALLRMRRS